MHRYLIAFAGLVLLGISACSEPPENAERKPTFLSIGTGSVTGVYYQVGGTLATLLSERLQNQGIRALVESTGGSVYNINAVLSGDLQLGLAQSDRQHQAIEGLKEWQDQPQAQLRSLCSLHPEVVTLVAARDAGIEQVDDLRGKRVNIGNLGSGQRGNSLDVLAAYGIDLVDLQAMEHRPADAPQLLQEGRLDAFFYTVGHPNSTIAEALSGERTAHIIPLSGPAMDQLLAERAYYTPASIDLSLYPNVGSSERIPAFGVRATLIAAASMDDDTAYAITRCIFEELEVLRQGHPALTDVNRETMLQGLSAPLHAGASRYLQEAGLR